MGHVYAVRDKGWTWTARDTPDDSGDWTIKWESYRRRDWARDACKKWLYNNFNRKHPDEQ